MMVDKAALHQAIDELPPQKLEQLSDYIERLRDELQQDPDWFGKLHDLFAPVRESIAASGMSDEEVNQILDEALDEVRRERKA